MGKLTIIIAMIMALNVMPVEAKEDVAWFDCIGNDGQWHTFSSDPYNGTDILIDGENYRFVSESKIGNKKVSTFRTDSGIIANVILIVDPENNTGDIYVVVYRDHSNKRSLDLDKLHLHCQI